MIAALLLCMAACVAVEARMLTDTYTLASLAKATLLDGSGIPKFIHQSWMSPTVPERFAGYVVSANGVRRQRMGMNG